jgi:Zn-dependent peptidase ImmA (M78 family)
MHQFERGFKTWAERTSLTLRQELGLRPHDPMMPNPLAIYLGVRLITPESIPNLPADVRNQLLVHDPEGWSAVSAYLGEIAMVIFNPRHSRGRQASDIMHELAHLILNHQPATIIMSQDGDMAMRTYNERQENEANWLAGCLLLPRDALLLCKRLKLPSKEASTRYGVSETLFTFRMRITGVDRQWQAAAKRFS